MPRGKLLKLMNTEQSKLHIVTSASFQSDSSIILFILRKITIAESILGRKPLIKRAWRQKLRIASPIQR